MKRKTMNDLRKAFKGGKIEDALPGGDTILSRAAGLVFGPRAESYGHPKDNFGTICAMWNAYLVRRGIINEDQPGIQPRDHAMMMVLIKVAREGVSANDDNLIDIAGYAATAERLQEITHARELE